MNVIRSSWIRACILIGLLVIPSVLNEGGVMFVMQPSQSVIHGLPIFKRIANNSFVTRSNTQLMLNGQPFRFAGANIYWLGLQEDPKVSFPSHFEVDDALDTAELMGATVVRSHTLGISTGCSLCLEPTLGHFNPNAFQHIDYAIQSAQLHHLKLIIPLTDNWHYYHGGKHNFTDWRNISDENQFYSNPQVISDFEQYITVLLNHINVYTGIAYKNDPTILAWEMGNELSAPVSWVQLIANYIKHLDPHHLIMDGNAVSNNASSVFSNDLQINSIDLYTGHYYPPDISSFETQLKQANQAGKVFIVGEFDWNTNNGDTLNNFLAAIQQSTAAGDLYWSLFPHSDSFGFVQHNEHYTLHYPGDTPDMRRRVCLLRAHAFAMQGQPLPSIQTPAIPLLETVIRNGTTNALVWQGTASAASYTIERSSSSPNGPWSIICNQCATDNDTPWIDTQVPVGPLWYRVIAYNLSGVASLPSEAQQAGSSGLMIDNLNDWSHVYQHSNNLTFDTTYAQLMRGDASRVIRTTATHEFITWKQANIVSFQAIAYFWPEEPASNISFYTSQDGKNWIAVTPQVVNMYGNWQQYIYTLQGLSGVNYVKEVWNNLNGQYWNPNLGAVNVLY